MQVPYFNLPKDAFPMVVEFFSVSTRERVWQTTVEDAGVLRIPALVEEYGKVRVRITYANGDVFEAETRDI